MVIDATVELGAAWDNGVEVADKFGLLVADGIAVDGDAAGDSVLPDDMLEIADILGTMLSDDAPETATRDDETEAATSED